MNIELTLLGSFELTLLRKFYSENAWYFSVETMLKVRRVVTMEFDIEGRYIYNQMGWVISVCQNLRMSLLLLMQIEEGVSLKDVTMMVVILKSLIDSARDVQEMISSSHRV